MKRTITFDSSPSARSKDENGFLRVAVSHITKETVNPYYGREIPGWEEAKLDPHKIYYGYRSGKELEKAAHTFDGLPLLLGHHIESADDPQTEHRVGSLGTDAKWNPPYLDNSLFVTDERGIKAVENGDAKELSCAYMYDPEFTPGEFDGHHYDFVMTNIRGNHVALVEEGRAGPDVVVADAAIENPNPEGRTAMSKLFDRFKGAIDGSPEEEEKVAPTLDGEEPSAGEQESEMVEDEDKVEKVNSIIASLADKLSPEEMEALKNAVTDLAAAPTSDEEPVEVEEEKDEEVMEDEEEEPLDAAEAVAKAEEGQEEESSEEPEAEPAPAEEKAEKPEAEDEEEDEYLKGYMKKAADACGMDAESEEFQNAFAEGMKYAEGRKKPEVEPEAKDEELEEKKDVKAAMDAAIKKVKAESLKHFRALSTAAEATRSVLGNIDALAFDSAEDIYGAALKKAGVDLKGHPKSAYRSMFSVMRSSKKSSRMAQDEASTKYAGAFAGLNRIKH